MENERLSMVIKGVLDGGDEAVAEEATAGEVAAVFEVDKLNIGAFVVLNGELV